MRWYFIRITTIAVLALVCGSTAHAQQTIVFFRHGEKPSAGLGQLTCQGLNRALALPDVLNGKFGKPDYLYAPNPAVKISDPTGSYFYVRPLATIEPTAIRAGKSVNTNYGYNNISGIHGVFKHLDSQVVGGKLIKDEDAPKFFDQDKLDELRQRQINTVKYLDSVVFPKLYDIVPKDTFITVTADHGELFGEQGYFGHGPIMHEKVFEVPFLEAKVK
jgi:hypothetical protein